MKKGIVTGLLFGVLFAFSISSLNAQETPKPEEPQPAQQPKAAPKEKGMDIIFILDDSGSMKETDAKEFRKLAVKAFLDLTQDRGGDNIGIVRFAGWQEMIQEGFVVYPLTQIPEDEEKRKETIEKIKDAITQKIIASGQGTDFNFAFKVALEEMLKSRTDTNRSLWVILLTDGEMYVRQEPGTELPDFYKDALGNLPSDPKTLTKLALNEFENKVLPEVSQIENLYVTCVNLLDKENQVLQLIAQKLNAKVIQGTRENLKSVFLEALASLPEGVYRPGITKGFGYLKSDLKMNETNESVLHIYQGASVTKAVVFATDSRFSVSLVNETGQVVFPKGNETVPGTGEEYRVLTLKDIPWGDYKLIVKNESDKEISVERIVYAQFAIELALANTEIPSVDAGDTFTLTVQMKDNRDNSEIVDPALLKETDIIVKMGNEETPFRDFTRFSGGTSIANLKVSSDSSSIGGEALVSAYAAIIPQTLFGGYAFKTAPIQHKVQVIAPVLHIDAPSKALQYQKLTLNAQVLKGSLTPAQKENGIKLYLHEEAMNKDIELVLFPKDNILTAEIVLEETGTFKLKDAKFDSGRVENADLSVTIEERQFKVGNVGADGQLIPLETVRLEATEEQTAGFQLGLQYSLAPDEEGVATVSFVPKRPSDSDAVKIETPPASGKTVLKPDTIAKLSFTALAKEGLPEEAGEIVITAEVKDNPKTKLERKIAFRFLVKEKPFPWWWIVIGAAALLTIILLLVLTGRPVFESQQLWYGVERRYILREFGKRSFTGTEEAKESLQIILKGSKKNPISYLKPMKSELPIYVDDVLVTGYKALTHGAFIDIRIPNSEALTYRFFEREPSVEEYMEKRHLPGEGEEYFLIVESES